LKQEFKRELVKAKQMESLDFILVVIPLAIIVATLTGVTYYYARREEFEKHKRTIIIQKFLSTRSKQQALIRKELERITTSYESGNIDEHTYERLQNVLFMTQEKLRYEAGILLNEKDGLFTKTKELPVEKILLDPELDEPLEPETRPEEETKEATPKKREKVKPQVRRKAKRKQAKKKQAGRKKKLQLEVMVKDNAPLKPNGNEQPVPQ